MPNIPNWDRLTDEEKIQALHDWCNLLSTKVQQQQDHIETLHGRLRTLEGRPGNLGSS